MTNRTLRTAAILIILGLGALVGHSLLIASGGEAGGPRPRDLVQ